MLDILNHLWEIPQLAFEHKFGKYAEVSRRIKKRNTGQISYQELSSGQILDDLLALQIKWRKSGSITSSTIAQENVKPVY